MALFSFTPWRKLEVDYRPESIRKFFLDVAKEGKKAFQEGMDGKHTGRVRRAKNRSNSRASVNRARAEYPANDSGRLRKSISGRSTPTSATIGTNTDYSVFLRAGTKSMRRRKMSDDALQAGIARARGSLRDWVQWTAK